MQRSLTDGTGGDVIFPEATIEPHINYSLGKALFDVSDLSDECAYARFAVRAAYKSEMDGASFETVSIFTLFRVHDDGVWTYLDPARDDFTSIRLHLHRQITNAA